MKDWLTVKEAALVVGRHERNIYRWIEAGTLGSRTSAEGVLLVLSRDVARVESVTRRGRPKGSANRR